LIFDGPVGDAGGNVVRSRQVPENEAPPVLGHLPARSLTVSAIIGLAPPSSDGDTPGMGGDIQKVSSGSPFEATIGFSRAVRVGDRVLVSGTGPVRPDGSCDSDPTGQARRCFEIVAGYGRLRAVARQTSQDPLGGGSGAALGPDGPT